MSNEIRVENLTFQKNLINLTFILKEGTINALMGRSGSGKTSLLKSIFGLVKYEGTILYNNLIITDDNISEIRKNFGIYLGISNLENKNVFLNLIEPLKNLNYPNDKAKKKVYEISRKLGIENLLYKELNVLSHSEKKVVSFAQSIIHDPKVILIDCLFDSLDVYYKNKVVGYLKQLKKSKKAIVIFTTNDSEDLLFADELIIIKTGKIVSNGTIDDLIKDEKKFIKSDIKLPFLIDLSYKLKSYELIDKLIYNTEEMVDELWK